MKNKSIKNRERIVVIGAGMAGLGVALGLARLGCNVLVIKKSQKGASTPAAGGILDPFLEMSPGQPLFQLSREAFFQYPEMIRRLELKAKKPAGYKKTGMLFVAMNHQDMKELEKRYSWQKTTGIPVVWRSRVTVLEKDPAVNPRLFAGLYYPTVARVHPKQLTAALEAYAKSLGVRFINASKAVKIVIRKKAAVGVKNGRQFYEASKVVNATGAWAGVGDVGPKLPVSPAKGHILLVRSRKKISTILHSLDGGYIVPWEDPKSKQGSYNYLLGSTVEKAGFDPSIQPHGLRKVLEKNVRIMPELKNAIRLDAWAGLRPFSELKSPIIGPSKLKGLYLAAGYYRSGILIGCRAGELLAQAIVTGKMPRQIKPFSPRKFLL